MADKKAAREAAAKIPKPEPVTKPVTAFESKTVIAPVKPVEVQAPKVIQTAAPAVKVEALVNPMAITKPKEDPPKVDNGDFKNSLAAMIGRGKPTYKKPVVTKVEEAPKDKVKVDMYNSSDEEEEKDNTKPKPNRRVTVQMDALFMANQKVGLTQKALAGGRRNTTKYNLDKFDLSDEENENKK